MLGRADEGLCPALRKRQRHYGMEIGIIRTTMTELNTSRLFFITERQLETQTAWHTLSSRGRANDELSNGTFQQLGTQTAWHTLSSRGRANDELANVSRDAVKSDKGVSTS